MNDTESIPATVAVGYKRFGVPLLLISGPHTDHETLLTILEIAEPRIPDNACEVVPTSFNPDDPKLRAFPRPLNWRWTSCELALRAFKSSGIMMRLPLFWQVEPALFAAGQAAGAPIFVNDQGNMPVGAAAIRTASMDTVVTDTEDAQRFSSYLLKRGAQFPAAWIIVHPILQKAWTIPAPLRSGTAHVAQEVHLFPGVPVLEQCEKLAARKEPVFHLSESYLFEVEGGATYLTSIGDDPLPLFRYALPVTIAQGERCSCGKKVATRVEEG
ncbi:hypothetical protein A3D71_00295 [Candidatus Kaiserbacteria bacterium RIFCSPHIGHO2_02_FULL_55_20]|uniref:Uncharacterized protein n=1 Tax=Candidatus Kaiserbacteria bacterium RIFCSPHIGHO2_02_FULL_55_20 TaxID=1798497 RepID=A0A1F6DVY1_9BACT|nr:MAG: hypothetical protein A2680_03215 [Candidatus Kaiserbacteria bacterium RIFCSPHIGHO2_01_FULL_55_37]OGG65526.1 MAG: hypothetical protein A3D71_00295 [Candidatus Kaiserbacteria bacterium RIFCSPHIGHO2_02_FULL_55_20]